MSFIDQLFQRATEEAQSLLLAALDQLAEGVIVADTEGQLIYVNPAAAAIHGVSELHVKPDEYTETYHLLTVDGDPYPPSELPLTQTVVNGATIRDARWKIAHPDGHIVDAVGSSRPVLDKKGNQVASVLTLADRTSELADQAKLALALETKDSLLREVNHRVRNNLALVNSLLTLYGRRIEDPQAKTAFGDASARVGVLVDIHRQLDELDTHRKIEVVAFLAHLTRETVRSVPAGRDVELVIKQYGSAMLSTDPATTLALALNELTLNSLKHAFGETDQPKIELEIRAGSNMLSILYCDNGRGFGSETGKSSTGVGQALISQLTTSLSASLERNEGAKGFCVEIDIPLD